ncbi:adenylosuccinate lyase [Rhodocaloribacter litoris]|uniref:adenylosuccinate lyase n=1 Tax=Rhodocaloribacter litoris TaxID=2558931 RepID=UPI001421ECAF|nr:adenylosuccinate lyase [Rhodocaloribacter litoris]QXD15610.1 adenylosuccinate lyase [Rhodocaloribacter litoris]
MIDRYTRPEMGELWSEEQQYQSWLEVELAACAAWAELGVIPKEDVEKLYANARFDVRRIHELEKTTRHDVVAFTRAVSETLGPEKKWVHYGLTSSDVVDTALSYRLKRANALILEAIDRLRAALAEKARAHRYTLMMGRTHGVHAEPTTFGLKMALYYDEMNRNRARFEAAAEGLRVGKISGAVGTFAHLPPEVERLTCERLGLKPAPISTQVLQRDLHAHYLAVLALIGASLEKMAVEVRGLQKSEVREVEEAFGKGQKGSSAMPHKRNPVGSENITGCARLLRGYMVSAYENVALWHERDISHSSVERVVLPDATTLLHYALHRFAGIVEELVVYPEHMRRNMERTFGLYNSQRLLLKLIDKGLSREAAYDLVQPRAMRAWEEERSFKEIVANDPEIRAHLSREEIDEAFDPAYHLRHVDHIFERVGL